MKVDITYKCSMHCTHCLSDCNEHGQNMTLETFRKVIEFNKKYQPNLIFLTGGEIFEHPQIEDFIEIAAENFPNVMLATNGQVLSSNDEIFSLMRTVKSLCGDKILIQVTNDVRYYPQKLSPHQKTMLRFLGVRNIETVLGLYPQGRAVTNYPNANWLTIAPKCANIRLLAKQRIKSLSGIISRLAKVHKFCTPTIAPDGSLKLGESALCPNCTHIDDTEPEIIHKILNCNCTACKIPLERMKSQTPMAYQLMTGEI